MLGLYSLDQRYAAAQARVGSLHRAAISLREQRVILRHQLTVARRGTRISQQRLAERLRALYEQGNVEPLDVVLGASSLDEAMTNLDNLKRVSGQGEDELQELKSARAATLTATRKLAQREAALAAETRAAEAAVASLARTVAERHSYIGSLANQHRLNEQQISTLVARAQAASLRSATLARTTAETQAVSFTTTTTTPSLSTAAGRTMTVSATGYALPGHTSSGLPVGWGVVAVDPSVIPLGTHMTIPGYGEAVAADTGGAVVGGTIDLWFPTVAQANAWGRRVVTIVVH